MKFTLQGPCFTTKRPNSYWGALLDSSDNSTGEAQSKQMQNRLWTRFLCLPFKEGHAYDPWKMENELLRD